MVKEFITLASLLESSTTDNHKLRIQGVCPSARALVAAFLSHRNPGPILCIAADWKEAQQFSEELAFFTSLFLFNGPTEKAGRQILHFPPGLTEPFILTQASTVFIHDRIRTLLALLENSVSPVVVTSCQALQERVPPKDAFSQNVQRLRPQEQFDRDTLSEFLQETGYKRVPVVEAPGEYAVRGSLIDVYPLPEEHPCRIDFFGDMIDSIRTFHPDTQRSREPVQSLTIPPASLFISRAIDPEGLRTRIKERADHLNRPVRNRMEFLDRIESGLPAHELPVHLPFFYPKLHSLMDYLGQNVTAVLLNPGKIRKTQEDLESVCAYSVEQMIGKGRIIPSAKELYLDGPGLWEKMNQAKQVTFSDLPFADLQSIAAGTPSTEGKRPAAPEAGGALHMEARTLKTSRLLDAGRDPQKGLAGYVGLIQNWIQEGQRVFLVCGSEPDKARLANLLHEYDLKFVQPPKKLPFWEGPRGLYLLRGRLSGGFLMPAGRMVFLHEEDIFGKKVRKHRIRETPRKAWINLEELKPGDHVVHLDFGIGRYQGLETLNIRGHVNDYLHLQYMSNDKLYLPVDRASRIQKYVSTEDHSPSLDKLGGTSWIRAKQRVKASVLAMAEELVSLYATRMVKNGYSFSKTDPSFQEFEASFPYEETPDQMGAIEDVILDMEKDKSMDRLVCGDVGYGKTEVAIRAAYKAVMDGRQVAVLVPTTVLAQQHYVNFMKRFEEYPVEIQMLSRFRTTAQQRVILQDLAKGKIDIIIGTHRLIQKDVTFRELGLLILDEEQRFGVRHKETIKKIRTTVDVLTLSATPIPRTMQLSLLGLRDLSTISTPPQDRHAIDTYIIPFDSEIICRAIDHELARGGQVFFVHNRVSDIESIAAKLGEIVPHARIAVGHGQMPERALEKVMLEFVEARYDILVCTTIIESGLDIPNANTLLVHRADRFGLAQLYQLRGRVGRSERQAYTYLIVPDEENLTEKARKRLEALYEFTELGSGFRIARHDLEIRGAGNLLGTSQSGQIRAVGYDLYMEFLEKAIRKLKGEEVMEEVDPEIHLELPAYLPESYIEDSTQRLSFYKRLATATDLDEAEQIRAELEDRYGPLPSEAEMLLNLMHIKVRLRRLRIKEARLAEEGLMLCFAPHTTVSVDRILQWATREPERVRLFPDNRLLVRLSTSDARERLDQIQQILAWMEKGEGD